MDNYNVYVHVTLDGKRYYGTTKQKVKKRWKNGKGYENQPYFYDAIQEFGWNNIEHIVIARGLTQEEAYWLEEELIKEFDTTNRDKGYNIAKGGKGTNGCKYTEESKKKMSENHWDNKGENHPQYDVYHTEEIRKKISDAHKGKNNPRAKSVICITTKRIFYTTKEGAEYYGIKHASHITKCCKGKVKSCGKLNGQRLVWRYLIWNHNKKYRINKEK